MLLQVADGVYMDTVRTGYPGAPLLNLIFIPGYGKGRRSLLVDCGLPSTIAPQCRDAVEQGVKELGISYDRLDCILTHSHRDHVGQAAFLNRMGARVLLNPADMRTREDQFNYHIEKPERRKELFRRVGLDLDPPADYEAMWNVAEAYIRGFEETWHFDFEPVCPGDTFEYGGRSLRVVPLPGHTQGHIGLWDREDKLLFSGDTLLKGISPIVGDAGDYPDALEDYLGSLRDIKHVYGDCLFIPGHGDPFRDPADMVDEVVNAYLGKCSLMYDCVRRAGRPVTIRTVSIRTYGREGRKLSDAERRSCFLIWFKTSACLHYMKKRGLVKELDMDGVSMWTV